MANNCLNTETKCISRKGPFIGSWAWCVLLKCLLFAPCVVSNCAGMDITVAIYPQGNINVPYGSPLEMFCVGENYTSNDIQFTVGGQVLPSEVVNITTIRLYIPQPPKQVKTYYCKNMKRNKICTTRVTVDSPPPNVTDFNCVSKNLDVLNCSWTSPETISNLNYSLTFSINNHAVNSCNVNRVGKTRFCIWNTQSQPRYRQQEEKYFFHLETCSIFGCNKQNIIIDHFSIVKPDPPSDLKVLSNGTHSVVLQWSVPNNMVDLLPCNIDHRIEYQIAKIDNRAYFHSVDATTLPPNNKTYRFQLTNLPYAHMQYEVRIYIKSKKAEREEFWSDFSYIVFHTASEIPRRPPEMAAGAFDQAKYENKRVIYVYWKQLEEYEEAGANFTYKVVTQGNRQQTLWPDKNKSLSYVIINDASLDAMTVSVWSFNINGSSVNSSHLYIPPESETHHLGLTSFTKLAYENGTYELSWDGIDNIDNYTLFWCQHNTTKICTGRMNYTVLAPHKNNHMIDLPRDYRYQFAISVNNGTKTSGMVWAKCDISKDGIEMYGFPVHLKYDAPNKSSVPLYWTMDCALQEGIVTGYNITYCPVIRTSSLCDNSVGNQSVYISDPKKMDIVVTNLLPFRTYQFTIALNTTYGLKTIENATAVITTSEDTPTSPRNITITDVKNDSLTISWDPPLHRNGNIGKYVIYNFGNKLYEDKVSSTDVSRRQVTLTGLQGFSNYSFNVQACNIPIGLCSEVNPNDAIFVRTRIGPPSRLKAPSIRNNPDLVKWDPPLVSAGTVDLYQIKRIKDEMTPEIINTTNLFYSLIHCEGVVVGETYQVRALNFDEDKNHGVIADKINVILPVRERNNTFDVYAGEWSEPSTVACRNSGNSLIMTLILFSIFASLGMGYITIKLYRKYRKMKDIKPALPVGLGVPEKEPSKYTYGGWNPANKDEKPSSDEMLLLPSSKNIITTENKQKENDNCGSSDHTDSTALTDSSRGPMDRQISTSDDGSNSSLHLEIEPVKIDDNTIQEEEDVSESETDGSENSTYFGDQTFKRNPKSGYIQPLVNPISGYVPSIAASFQSSKPAQSTTSPGSSYVMAGLSPQIFTTGVAPPTVPPSGYVRQEIMDTNPMTNFPKMVSAASNYRPDKVSSTQTLPQSSNFGDSSYIQLQSLDSLPSLKSTIRNTVPLKQPASSGYMSQDDVLNKHLNNMLSGGHIVDESAIVDPTMSPDAYCRFSWSTDPANDNLHSLLTDSSTVNSNK